MPVDKPGAPRWNWSDIQGAKVDAAYVDGSEVTEKVAVPKYEK